MSSVRRRGEGNPPTQSKDEWISVPDNVNDDLPFKG